MSIASLSTVSGMASLRMHQLHQAAMARSFTRLATGLRINSGADDPAGLIASENLSATLAELEAQTNANERAVSIADTADAAVGEVSDLLVEAKSLVAANANSAGLSDEEKAANQMELDSILASVDRISNTTRFNGSKLLDGSATVSASGSSLKIDSTHSTAVGETTIDGEDYALSDLRTGGKLAGAANSEKAAAVLEKAISDVATTRGKIGAYVKNTLQTNLNTLATHHGRLSDALSMLRDTNYAAETIALSRSSTLDRSTLLTGRLVSLFA